MCKEPIAYFLTWRTYGSWLPGDKRGWFKNRQGFRKPNPALETRALLACRETPVVLDAQQRDVVENTVDCALPSAVLAPARSAMLK